MLAPNFGGGNMGDFTRFSVPQGAKPSAVFFCLSGRCSAPKRPGGLDGGDGQTVQERRRV